MARVAAAPTKKTITTKKTVRGGGLIDCQGSVLGAEAMRKSSRQSFLEVMNPLLVVRSGDRAG